MADRKTDVAHTLADALQKIENILSDDRNQAHYLAEDILHHNGNDNLDDLPLRIRNYAVELGSCVERLDQNFDSKINIPRDTINTLGKWLQQFEVRITIGLINHSGLAAKNNAIRFLIA